ncbi:MAG: SurA N-terminal domain-containing protein [Gammaproteobacteria bacterium]|nr:SurA N-terminal domain-containing protein [Gammaproteobacteria bacterium]
MLTQIRERATGWLAWVIVILISIPFALWGIQSYFENPADLPVATVNGEEIPLYSYYNELSRRRQALLAEAGGNVNPASLESQAMREEVMDSMISNRLIGQYVRESDYYLSDARLKQRIESNPAFLQDGRFDPDLYRILLRNNGYNPQTYEALERESATVEQLSVGLAASSFVPETEVDRLLALQAQTRKADYAVLPAERFEAAIDIGDAAAEQHYKDNPADYEAPARVQVAYIELSIDGLAAGLEPTEAEIAQAYEDAAERYTQPESRKASHILFAVEADADDDARADILASAEAVLAEAEGGADFAELAQTHSDDPGSKERGGDLGIVARGQMVAPFEAAVFDMTEGEIRGPVETRFGYHIIRLTELQEAQRKPLDEVREEVTEEVKRAQAETLFAEQGEAFENLVFEEPDSLGGAAAELGLEVQHTGWFTERAADPDDSGGITGEAPFRRAAFGEDVLNDDLNSAAIELGFERLIALRKTDYEEAHTRDFDEVREEVVARLKREQAAQDIGDLAAQLLDDLRAGGDWAAALEEQDLEAEALAETRDAVPGNLSALGDAVFSEGFSDASPETAATDDAAAEADAAAVDTVESTVAEAAAADAADAATPESAPAPVYGGVFLANGDYAIYRLNAVIPGDLDAIEPQRRRQLRERMLARDGGDLYDQLLAAIRDTASVVIDPDLVRDPETALEIGTQNY